jgi:hypothetical protein
MKIQLDAQSGVSVLTVSESIASPELDVLKAGLIKLLAGGKSPLIIDLTRATIATELRSRLAELANASPKKDAIVMIASSDPTIATAPSVEECLKILASPAAKLMAQEAQLKVQVAAARAQRDEVLKKLDDTAALGAEIKKLRRESGDLKTTLALLEDQIQALLKTRKPPFRSDYLSDGWDDFQDVVAAVFAPSGLVKARTA